MILNTFTTLKKIDNEWFIELFNINFLITEINLWNNNQFSNKKLITKNNWWVYIKNFINKKQILETSIFLFLSKEILDLFLYLIGLDGFGIKSTNNICQKNPYKFIELKKNNDINGIKNFFKLNTKQISSIFNNSEINSENDKIKKISQILTNLGYKKNLIQKIVNKNLELLNENDYSLLIKKFVELVKNEMN